MNLKILQIGKTKDKWIETGILEYKKRLEPMCKLEVIELADESLKVNNSIDQVKLKEAKACMAKIHDTDFVVLLDEQGNQKSSLEFSQFLTNISINKNVVFVIGGVFGTDKSLADRADITMGLSKMTFTHRFARLILMEQIYRAMMIINNRSYHY